MFFDTNKVSDIFSIVYNENQWSQHFYLIKGVMNFRFALH
jgi:hypothetical protein